MAGLWITVDELEPQFQENEYAQDAVKTASYLMWSMSGRKYFGTQTITERYVRFAPLLNMHLLQEAALVNAIITKTTEMIEPWVSAETRIRLRSQPVQSIQTVRSTKGEVYSPDKYYVVDRSTIQFSEGALIVPADIEVTYTYGMNPPTMGKVAAKRLAQEFIRLWTGDDDCALPRRVTSVSRQGVNYTILDQQDFIAELRTGIYEIDLFLKTNNPDGAKKRARVFTPDIPRARKYTRKTRKLVASARDIIVPAGESKTITVTLASINAAFLYSQAGWTPEVVLRSYDGTYSKTVSGASYITVTSTNISITIPYADAFSVLRMIDPGTWDLYGVQNGASTYITSGNLDVDLT